MVEIRQVVEGARAVLEVLKMARIFSGLVALGCAVLSLDKLPLQRSVLAWLVIS